MDVWLAHDALENGLPSMQYVKDILRKVGSGDEELLHFNTTSRSLV